jgi:hypothetical protein
MQSGLRWSRSYSRRRFPVVGTPYAPPSARPCGRGGTMASVRRCALCGWSVACGQSCGVCPRPPLCFAAARHQPCALVCPSAPRGGSLSPLALVVGFCYKFGSCSRTEYGGYRPKRPVSQRGRWLTSRQPSPRPAKRRCSLSATTVQQVSWRRGKIQNIRALSWPNKPKLSPAR